MSKQAASLQITQLRTKNIKQKQLIEEKDKQIERQEEDIIELQLQKDSYIQQVRLVQQEFDKYRQENQNLVTQKVESAQGNKNFEHDIKILEDKNKSLEEKYNRSQADLYDEKERGKSQRDQIKQLYKKINDPTYKVDEHETYLNEKIKLERDLKERTRNLEQLRRDMEDILAENRILRKLAEVPDNYGFDLEEIKLAEQEKIENYKQKVRYLEGEVEDLEKERTHLRAKLRTATLKKGGAADIPDEYNDSIGYRKLEEKVRELQDRCEEYEQQIKTGSYNNRTTDDGHAAQVQQELLDKVTKLIENNNTMHFQPQQANKSQMQESFHGQRIPQQQDLQGAQNTSYQGKYAHHGRPPHHLSGRYGDEANITNGFSHRFGEQEGQGQKLAVHLDRLYSESGFDQVQAKQEIATLQLMNLENMKIIEEKEKEYSYLHQEMRELTDEYTKMLMIQDALFEQHFDRKTRMENEITRLKEENDNFIKINSEQKLQIMDLQKDIDIVKSKDSKTLNDRLAEMVEIKAKLEVNLIQLARKYDCLQADYQDMNQKYVNVSKDYSDKEQKYIHRIQNLIDWKNRANHQLKILLEEQKKSVPEDEYTNLVERERDTRDKLLAQMNDNSSLKIQLGQLRGAEREIQEKNEVIQGYEEEMIDINMEMEVIKKRLEETDSVFGKFQESFRKLVETIKRQNLTPYQVFQLMDGNKDGQLSKTEFTNILEKLSVPLDEGEIDVIFLFLDLDGSENIDYNEFLRRLRRSGVTMRRKEEEIIYELYQKIMNVGWNLRDLFETMDVDGNNDITQEELKKGLNTVNIQITDDDVNEIFKMADTSGDGAICYDEFRILFQNVVSDSFKETITTNETELDPKKQIVLKIDVAVREMGLSLIDIYKIIDQDENQRITKSELKKLFDKINSEISDKEVTMLFQDIDNDNNGSIDYNELLAYVRNAKKEQAKIDRMKRINQKVEDIRNKGRGDGREDTEQNEDLGKIDKLHLKIQMLELRDKNNNKRQEQQKEKIQTQAFEIIKLEKRIQNMESDLSGVQKNYYDARQRAMAFSEKVKCCLPQEQSKQIEALKQRMITENTDLRGALRTYKALYETTIDHVKTLKLTKEKEEHQQDTLKELQKNIKDLQGESDDKALVGKLYHQLMMSRWQQGEINKKYDNKCDESQKFEIAVQNLETELEENEQLLGFTHQELIQMKRIKDKEIEVVSGKIIPTVTSNKIEELHNKISEMVESKLNLEITNRQLREVNNELQLKCDFYETRKQTIEDIKQELKYNKADRHQQKIIEQGQYITELKLAEMKAKREAGMAREKEEYYMRVNRQHTETIKLMESEIAQNAQKFNEREEFWTKRVNEREHMIFKKQDEKQEAKMKERKEMEAWQENTKKHKSLNSQYGITEQTEGDEEEQGGNYMGKSRQRTNQSGIDANQKLQDLEQQNDNLQEEYKKLFQENQKLTNRIEKMKETGSYGNRGQSSGRNYSREEQEEISKKAINQESEKIAQVAQKTISTLQELIDEKNMQLDKKEDVIKRMRRDFMLEKDKDIKEIRRLNEKVVNQNMSAMQRMQQSVVQQNGQIVESTQYWGDVGELITEKDQKLTEIGIRFEKEQEAHNETIKLLRKEKDIVAELEDQIQLEKKRNQTGKLMKQIEASQKLVKEREKELKNVRKLMQDLRTDYTQMAEDKYTAQNLKDKVVKEDKTKIQQMDTQLKNALEHVRNTKSQLEQHKKELEEMNLQNIKLKEENTKLKQEKQDLLDGKYELSEQQKKRRSENMRGEDRMARVMKGEKDGGSFEQQKRIDELEEENKKLQEENGKIQKQLDFIRQQKSKEGIIDRDGNLQGDKMQFENISELLKAIKKWENATPGWKFMDSIKEYDRKRNGQVRLQEFYMALETGGIKLKEKDKDLVMYSNFNDKLDQIHLDELYYAMNPQLVCKAQDHEEGPKSGGSTLRRGSSIKTGRDDDKKSSFAKPASRKETMDQRKEQGNAQLEKKLNIVNRQLYEAKKERDTLQNQMLNWKDKAIRLEKELQQANQNPKMSSVQKRQSMTQANAIGDLKDTIYMMEDKNEKLKVDIYRKDVEIQKLGEEKTKLEEEVKGAKLENSKARSKLDSLMLQKMGPDQARRESQGEKDQIIRNLKEKLEIQRKKDEDTTEKYYELLSYNKELEYVKENYDIQVERLQSRIVELEEYKKLYGHKSESPPPNNTIKKGLGMSRRR